MQSQRYRTFNRILVVDDDKFMRVFVTRILEREGYQVRTAANGQEGLDLIAAECPDLVLLDVVMPGLDGFATCERIRADDHLDRLPVIFVTAIDDPQAIYRIFEYGDTDYIGKPLRENELLARVRLHLELHRRASENDERAAEIVSLREHLLTGKLEHPEAFATIVTQDPTMFSIFQYAESIAGTSWPVLITGATGTGKELVARAIHELSRRPGEFVAVNVAGLDDNMFADTLFGHVKGAFTGAAQARQGMIERAAKGTLFLDEIGDLEPSSQVKLLRLLQEREYYPLGSDARKLTDARILVATNQNLDRSIEQGSFRDDLYYRLRTHHIHLPPLRQRRADIPLLARTFRERAASQLDRPLPDFAPEALDLLASQPYPGNIRELESLVMDALSRPVAGELLQADDLRPLLGSDIVQPASTDPSADDGPPPASTFDTLLPDDFPTLKQMNRFLIDQALERTGGNQTRAARLLGISRQALNKRLRRQD